MINYIWGAMILIGILYSALTGGLTSITTIAISASKDAVSLAVTMSGIIAMWSGLLKIAENSGLIAAMTRRLEPILFMLFPKIPKKHAAHKYIATNFIANILGVGWAATPAGLKAMEELQKLNKSKSTASNEMCLFMVINMSSLQLVSINLLAYRVEYNSENPGSIIGPGLFVTIMTTIIAVIVCKLTENADYTDRRRRQ